MAVLLLALISKSEQALNNHLGWKFIVSARGLSSQILYLIRNAPLLAGVCSNAEIVALLARKVHNPVSRPALQTGSKKLSLFLWVSSEVSAWASSLSSFWGCSVVIQELAKLDAEAKLRSIVAPVACIAASAAGEGGASSR